MKTEKSVFRLFTSSGKEKERKSGAWRESLCRLGVLKGSKSSKQGDSPCNYSVYQLSAAEWGRYLAQGAAACGITAYVFYRSVSAFFLLLPFGLVWPLVRRKKLCAERREELRRQFREAIQILASGLAAGYSVENAFSASVKDLEEMYGKNGMITREFSYIAHQLTMNRTVETLLLSFAKRSGLEEVKNFSVIFAVSKRSRGELVSVVNHVVHVISDRIQVREEIATMTAEKRFEQKIMNLMPFFIVFYVDVTSPGFFEPMYRTVAGRVVMTACLGMYLAACVISQRILQIEAG